MTTTQKMLLLALAATLVAAWLAPDPEDSVVLASNRQASTSQEKGIGSSPVRQNLGFPPRAKAREGGLVDVTTIDVLAIRARTDEGLSEDAVGLFVTPGWAIPPAPAIASRTTPTPEQSLPKAAPPSAPPLPFTVIGSMQEAGQRTIFLQHSGDSLVVRAGDTLLDQYTVEKIEGSTMVLRYLPLNQLQTLEVGREP